MNHNLLVAFHLLSTFTSYVWLCDIVVPKRVLNEPVRIQNNEDSNGQIFVYHRSSKYSYMCNMSDPFNETL